MLKVRIQLRPSNGGKRKDIAHANIVNTGMGTEEDGEYYAHFYAHGKEVRAAYLKGFRRQELGPWELVRQLLNQPNLLEGE